MSNVKAALVLEDGTTFEGVAFGHVGEAFGETVFYTGVVGYQEVITDPSYRRMLAVLTYPIIGAYGVNGEDDESPAALVSGVIVREYSPYYSNWRATGSLEDYLKARGVVGIREVDTRAVAVHLREHGEMRGVIASGDFDAKKLAATVKDTPSPLAEDLVRDITREEVRKPRGRAKRRLVAIDLGIKRSLLEQLADLGAAVEIVRCTADAKDILARKPHGILVAGGPGDPRRLPHVADTVRALLGKAPVLGIGLGHQALALALGCRIRRMKIGHRGVNYPVRDLVDGTSHITAQSHSFVVDAKGIPKSVEVTHTNQNDGTVEGIRCRKVAAWGVQFHPGRDEMERPSTVLEAFTKGPKRR